ncbi:MAG: HAD family hydrolase [Steroidobacteraceae bacterium]
MPKPCIIFDLDGTLIDSDQFDCRLYADAVREVLGNVAIRPRWQDYEHVTDLGILRDICLDNAVGFEACVSRVRESFGALVRDYLDRRGPCEAMAGALALFDRLGARSEFEVGIATGGWGHTARMKLDAAGFAAAHVPLTSSDDGHERVHIMSKCRARMGADGPTIYVGDGEWDRRASAQLGWGFIGIGAQLRGRCRHWYPDLTPVELLQSLESAAA